MTDTPTPQHAPVAFMRKERQTAGRPDTLFYWPEHQGRQCIAKAMDPAFGAHVHDLLNNERQVLRLLHSNGLPVCRLVDYPAQPDWLVTEFGGPSLFLLTGASSGGWPALPLGEFVSVWVHFLRRARGFVDLGAVPLDLSGRNLVVPLAGNGQLKLSEPLSIDHAHTVLPGTQLTSGALRRPVWIGARDNLQLAPEVRDSLQADQQKFLDLLKQAGAPQPGSSAMVNDPKRDIATQLWVNYSEPQLIQRMVDKGEVNANRFIQYAVGYDIHGQLTAADPLARPLAQVISRLCAPLPSNRYASLEEAAQALQDAIGGHVAMASAAQYQPRWPDDLRPAQNLGARPRLDLGQWLTAQPQAQQQPSRFPDTDLGSTALVQKPHGDDRGSRSSQISGASAPPPSPAPLGAADEAPPALAGWGWTLLALATALALGIPLGNWLAGV